MQSASRAFAVTTAGSGSLAATCSSARHSAAKWASWVFCRFPAAHRVAETMHCISRSSAWLLMNSSGFIGRDLTPIVALVEDHGAPTRRNFLQPTPAVLIELLLGLGAIGKGDL